MVLPAASGKAKPRDDRMQGKFHGLITATTPIGRRTARETLPCSDGSTSPIDCQIEAAAAGNTSAE